MAGISGRLAKAYRGTVGTLAEALDALTDGGLYFIVSKGETSALPASVPVGYPFIANGTITLATGDSCYPLAYADDAFCIVKDKSVSASKGTYDVTTDCDDVRTFISDRLPSETLSLSGNVATDNDVLKAIEAHFNYVVTGDGAGVYTVKDLDHEPMWIVLDYTVRDRVSGENIKMKVIPVLFTGLSTNAPSEGIQDFSVDGQSAGKDELGNYGAVIYDVVPTA